MQLRDKENKKHKTELLLMASQFPFCLPLTFLRDLNFRQQHFSVFPLQSKDCNHIHNEKAKDQLKNGTTMP